MTHEQLLAAIRARLQKQTSFGYGIITADKYVDTMQQCVGLEACYKYAATRNASFDDVRRKAAKTLVYSNEDMLAEEVLYEKQVGVSVNKVEGIELPRNTLMVFQHVLTSPRKDRDGDILRTQGARPDPKMLLLWQHVHTLPIGKMLKVIEHSAKRLSVISAIVDINELAHDAAVMVDNKMGRFSHGFRALSFSEMKGERGDATGNPGFDVSEFEIMEESLVSVPSNVDAVTEEVILSLVEGGKLTSPLMKSQGKSIREKRAIRVPVTIDLSVLFNGKAATNDQHKAGCGTTQGEGKACSCGGGTPKEAHDKGKRKEDEADDKEVTCPVCVEEGVDPPGVIKDGKCSSNSDHVLKDEKGRQSRKEELECPECGGKMEDGICVKCGYQIKEEKKAKDGDEDKEECPECGAPMEDGECQDCGYAKEDEDESDLEDEKSSSQKYDPNQPRDPNGQWGGGGPGSSQHNTPASAGRQDDMAGTGQGAGGYEPPDDVGYAKMGGDHVKVEANGQLKLKKPKTPEDAMQLLKEIEPIFEAAMKDVGSGGMASLRANHAKSQFQRALGWAKLVAGSKKDAAGDLLELIAKLEKKYGVKAEKNPSDDDPQLKRRQSDGTKSFIGSSVPGLLENSWEATAYQLRESAKLYLLAAGVPVSERSWVWTLATFPDYVVVSVSGGNEGVGTDKLYRIDWKSKDGKPSLVGMPQEVKIETTSKIIESKHYQAMRAQMQLKSGRMISSKNLTTLKEVHGDLQHVVEKRYEIERAGHALIEKCGTRVKGLIEEAEGVLEEEKSHRPQVLTAQKSMASFLSLAEPEDLRIMGEAVAAILESNKQHQLVEDYKAIGAL